MTRHKVLLRSYNVKPNLILDRRLQSREHERSRYQINRIKQYIDDEQERESGFPEKSGSRKQRLKRRILFFVQYFPLHYHLLWVRIKLAVDCHIIVASPRAHAPVGLDSSVPRFLHIDVRTVRNRSKYRNNRKKKTEHN